MEWWHGFMGSSSVWPTCVALLAEEWAGLAAWLGLGLGLGLGLAKRKRKRKRKPKPEPNPKPNQVGRAGGGGGVGTGDGEGVGIGIGAGGGEGEGGGIGGGAGRGAWLLCRGRRHHLGLPLRGVGHDPMVARLGPQPSTQQRAHHHPAVILGRPRRAGARGVALETHPGIDLLHRRPFTACRVRGIGLGSTIH